ncbi:MAG: class I SAM-dependent RNA methyltransferase [Kiritimatiellia bacterium]
MPVPGEEFTARVEAVAYPGRGIVRLQGAVVFVEGLLPGEEAHLRVTRVKPRYAVAEVVELLASSPDRLPVARDPRAFLHAPGCVYDHATHAAEVRIKQSQLESFLRRLPCGAPPFDAPFVSPLAEHYRNKIVLHAAWGGAGGAGAPAGLRRGGRSLRLGYVRDDGVKGVTDVAECLLAREPINARLRGLREQPATLARLRPGQTVTLRWTEYDGVMWWIDSPANPPILTESSPLGPMLVPADGFYQVNPEVAAALVAHVRDAFVAAGGAGRPLLDLYCGVGVFGLAGALAGGTPLLGVESFAPCLRMARRNAVALGVEGARFEAMDVARWLRSASADAFPWPDATVLLDPPRAGVATGALEAIASRLPARIGYVSCEPATLARDLGRLVAAGYRPLRARLFDMFPRTAHFESFVWMER